MLYDDDVTTILSDHFGDPMASADFRLDQLKDTSSCPACGSREPVRLGRDMDGIYGCSDCRVYEKCEHGRWTLNEDGGPTEAWLICRDCGEGN